MNSRIERRLSRTPCVAFGSVAASRLKNFNDRSQCNPAVGGLAWYFLAGLTAPAYQAATEFSWCGDGNRPAGALRVFQPNDRDAATEAGRVVSRDMKMCHTRESEPMLRRVLAQLKQSAYKAALDG